MAVPSPPQSAKDLLRSRALANRRAYARSLAPGLRAELEAALARIVLPHLIAPGSSRPTIRSRMK
jgi:hypothetical protein